MSVRTILIVLLALVFGTATAVGVITLRGGGLTEDTTDVVVADRDIPRFTPVTAEMVKVKQYPKRLVPAGAVSRVEDVVDRLVDGNVLKDEPVLDGRLTPKGATSGIGSAIPKGMRAVTIRTPHIAAAVAGLIVPGSKVDVMFTMRSNQPNDPNGGGSTTTLLHHVEILAVDQRTDTPADAKSASKEPRELRSVTLVVTPEQAARLDLAQNVGTLHLTLRNPLDVETGAAGGATLTGILGGPQGRPVQVQVRDMLDSWSRFVDQLGEACERVERAKVREEVPTAPSLVPVTAVAPPPPAPPRIRTLRGGIPSMVTIE